MIKHAVEIMKHIGECKDLTVTTISGFNSNIEDYLSGNCVALMVYYFSLHYAKTFLENTTQELSQPEPDAKKEELQEVIEDIALKIPSPQKKPQPTS